MTPLERRASGGLALIFALRMLGLFLVLPVFALEARHYPGGDDPALVGLALGVYGLVQALLQLPWVRAVQVRRVWPAGLAIQVEEHQPLARWGEGYAEMINGHGEVFAALLAEDEMRRLPLLQGPQGTARQVMERFVAFRELFATVGERPVQLSLSSRLAWRLTLDNGMRIEIGREHPKWPLEERLQRFVEVYAKEMAALENRPAVVDLRYPNGFAIKVAAVDAAKLKGK